MKNKIGVFIFTYNEECVVLEKLVDTILEKYPEFLIYIIDDGTKEGIYKSLETKVKYFRHRINLGIGFARKTAMKIANKDGLEMCIFIDGDGQHPVETIKDFIKCDGDIIIGSRFLENNNIESTTQLRFFAINMIRIILKKLFKIKISDPTSGFRMYRKKAIQILSEINPNEYPEVIEIAEARENGLFLREIPVKMRKRISGRTTLGFFKSIYYMFDISISLVEEIAMFENAS